MAEKTLYCTLDTETVGGASNPTGMYNEGCTIHDNEGNILAKTNILVMEHYDEIAKDDYAKKNFHLYEERLQSGELTAVATEEEAYTIVYNLCKFYGVKYVMAYNSGFDFVKTIYRNLLDEFEFIDLYLMALQTITHKKSFVKFCKENEKFSASRKTYSTSAETVYGYIINNPNFMEEHTALKDAEIEMEIFLACLKMHKKYTKNVHQWDCKENKCFPKIF